MANPLKKLIVCPYFGDLPPWMFEFVQNIVHLGDQGYYFHIDQDLEGFKKRVKDKLGLDCPIVPGSGKVSDYRAFLGVLYADEIKGYDFYGHCDFDMVFGDLNKWFPDSELEKLDVWSNHDTYICGPFTLYRNTQNVDNLYLQCPDWREKVRYPETNGWVEQEYSRALEKSGLRYRYSFFQGDPYNPPFRLKFEDGKLYQDGKEIAMLHFRRSKQWPL